MKTLKTNQNSSIDLPKEERRAESQKPARLSAVPASVEEPLDERATQVTRILEQIPYYRSSNVHWGINE